MTISSDTSPGSLDLRGTALCRDFSLRGGTIPLWDLRIGGSRRAVQRFCSETGLCLWGRGGDPGSEQAMCS